MSGFGQKLKSYSDYRPPKLDLFREHEAAKLYYRRRGIVSPDKAPSASLGTAYSRLTGAASNLTSGSSYSKQTGVVSSHPIGEAFSHPIGEASSHPLGEASRHPTGAASSHPIGEASSHPLGEASSCPAESASSYPTGSASRHPTGAASSYATRAASSHPTGAASSRSAGAAYNLTSASSYSRLTCAVSNYPTGAASGRPEESASSYPTGASPCYPTAVTSRSPTGSASCHSKSAAAFAASFTLLPQSVNDDVPTALSTSHSRSIPEGNYPVGTTAFSAHFLSGETELLSARHPTLTARHPMLTACQPTLTDHHPTLTARQPTLSAPHSTPTAHHVTLTEDTLDDEPDYFNLGSIIRDHGGYVEDARRDQDVGGLIRWYHRRFVEDGGKKRDVGVRSFQSPLLAEDARSNVSESESFFDGSVGDSGIETPSLKLDEVVDEEVDVVVEADDEGVDETVEENVETKSLLEPLLQWQSLQQQLLHEPHQVHQQALPEESRSLKTIPSFRHSSRMDEFRALKGIPSFQHQEDTRTRQIYDEMRRMESQLCEEESEEEAPIQAGRKPEKLCQMMETIDLSLTNLRIREADKRFSAIKRFE